MGMVGGKQADMNGYTSSTWTTPWTERSALAIFGDTGWRPGSRISTSRRPSSRSSTRLISPSPLPEMCLWTLGNGVSAADSCVTAVYLAARFLDADFESLLAFARACRGDVDTISAMAGALWGAANGCDGLPEALLDRLEECGRIRSLAQSMLAARSRQR